MPYKKVLAVLLAVNILSLLTTSAHAALTITLLPTSGPPGTGVTISGSEPEVGAPTLDHSCQVSSSPGGLISSPTCTVTEDAQGDYTVAGSFVVAGVLPGPYTVTVTVTADGEPYESGSAPFTVTGFPITVVPVNFSICVIRLGIEQPNGTVSWLLGYGWPGLPPSQCPERFEYYNDPVWDPPRIIVFHQFILNGTHYKIVSPRIA